MDESYWQRHGRNVSRRRFIQAVGAGISGITAAALVGCSSSNNNKSNATPGQRGAASSPSAVSPAGSATRAAGASPSAAGASSTGVAGAVRGGTWRSSTGDPFRGADPHINYLEPVWIGPLSYSWTHRYNVAEDKIILDMATKIEQPDNMTKIVHIRPDIKFHNLPPMNGRIATTDDLIYTYQRLPAVKAQGSAISPAAYSWMDLQSMQAPDKTTLQIKHAMPYADSLIWMSQHYFAVVGKEAVEAAGGNLTKVLTDAAGTGPYILNPQSDPNTKVVWNRNPDYFSHDHSDQLWFPQGGGYPDSYELRVLPDPATTQAQLISGDLDQLYYLILNVDKALANDFMSKGLQVQQAQANTNCQLNMAIDRFPDTRVRQALMKAIDYDQIIKNVYLGDGELAAPLGNGFPDTLRLPRAELAKYLTYDAKMANQLWSAAGSAAKSSYVLLSIPNQPFAVQMTNSIKESIEKTLPVKIEIQGVDVPTWLARVLGPVPKDWDFCVSYGESVAAVPDGNVLQTFQPRDSNQSNTTGFALNSPTPAIVDLAKQGRQLADAQAAESDPKQRTEKLYAYQRFLLDNAIPSIPLAVRKYDWLVTNKRVKNVPVKNDNFFRSNMVQNMFLDPNKP